MFGSVERAWNMGAAGVGATIYFGSEQSRRQIVEVVARPSRRRTARGMFTVLWCYLRNSAFKTKDVDYHVAADLTGQANHLGVTIQADIIKQKLPENNGGYNALGPGYGKTQPQGLRGAEHRQPDRPDPLPGDQLLPRPGRADQQRRRLVRARAIWPRRCARRSSTSAPAGWA